MYRENPEQADDRQYYDYHLDRNGSSLEAENEALRQPLVISSLPDANPHTCPECSWLCDCTTQPCSCCSGKDL